MSLFTFGNPDRNAEIADKSVSWWRLTALLAVAALFAGILLTGVSIWFLGAVALAGAGGAAYTFNFHIPAALVRLFALTRTAAKYGERLAGHKAALLDQVSRRAALFSAMAAAPKVRSASWQLGDQDRLADFIDDVEDVDYAKLRIDLPVMAFACGLAVLVAATLVVAPLALVTILPALLIEVACARRSFPRATNSWHAVRQIRRIAAGRLGAGLAAAVPLRAEHAWAAALKASFAGFSEAGDEILRLRRQGANFDFVVSFIGPVAAFSVLAAAWLDGHRMQALLPTAFVAFAWLALGEAGQGASRILLARIKQDAASKALHAWTGGPHTTVAIGRPTPSRLRKLEIVKLQRCAPDGRPLFGKVDLVLQAGQPIVLSGPSGCGKTSFLKQVAGWLAADGSGEVLGDGAALPPSARQRLVHLSLHDAAILSDTVRENLFAPAASDAECWEALDAVELSGRVRAAGGLDGWITQSSLSLGEAQRLNLARAFLSPLPVILLDEPGEHMDAEQACRVVERLLIHLQDRILLASSHGISHAWRGARAFRFES
ncbi:ATP-binding cassette domain-containing protein [Methylovirgula sp. 4M-Z18]|uniref:ATP-binding cassette domain-containing protein n=1 Tax=Methylovirgula sp. 4M-Z18 TaxID=2293567 RepID=UPI000E2FD142|nr:ATP-binding cassette domain-containing protein [Methylovirgula sp. 4M-Z18]RFB79897.1 ATP-binding cassette domain-containing protein [Methylovirgula sp. 4M-Z18]